MIPIARRAPGEIRNCRNGGMSGMPTGEELGHHPQALTTARYSRADRPDGEVRQRCDFVVTHALQSDEQNYRPLLLGQFGESAFQIAKLEPRGLIGRERQARATFLQFDAGALARVAASVADVLMVQDCEQPGPKIGSVLPKVDFTERAGEAVLDEVLCRDDVTGQHPRVAGQTGNQDGNLLVKVAVGRHPSGPTGPRSRGSIAVAVFRASLRTVQIHPLYHRLLLPAVSRYGRVRCTTTENLGADLITTAREVALTVVNRRKFR